MIDCPNKKCGSKMPDSYRYCIYCSAKLPKTEQNSAKAEKQPVSAFRICLVVFLVIMIAAVIIGAKILF